MLKLYNIEQKNKPEVWDKGTQYSGPDAVKCEKCGGSSQSDIYKLGVYLPDSCKTFGLIRTLGGIVGSEESVYYLKSNGIEDFSIADVTVTFEKCNSITDKFYWIKPNKIFELDIDNGPGPTIVCQACGRRMWKEKNLLLPKFKEKINSDIFQIKYTWTIIATENFIKIARNVPNGCYLEFEPWYYEG